MTGEAKAHPVILVPGDVEKFDIIREGQRLEAGEMIEWKGDDPAAGYEIFRIETPPSSYQDFFGHRRERILATQLLGCGRVSATEFLVDTLRPNRKYYYIFREIDVHDKPSNPTEVFEVELVDDNGLIFPRIKIYDFPKVRLEDESTTFRRYLLIKAGLGQDEIVITNDTLPESATDAEIRLGDLEERVFPDAQENEDLVPSNRSRFKIRITSKQTGKKIDINVSFKHLHDKELKCS
tara:strand:- start:126 stop:836 length:711 start_codon:yes stop_codon:yes gene_type:complete